ncbi:hypothetical protein MP478_08285 [Chryseobacterium sp. WG14]|uniref:hypothetical protein n=1 Tax=Chryseobacterium sp. WG14 TaxID=2926909 RepID=UPI00211DDC20|nr:hypothetical protein [Chryseobacterium sp. WG14]MCQ9639387.1 hypothetical protein [Chryseobacterium sp. WG14]
MLRLPKIPAILILEQDKKKTVNVETTNSHKPRKYHAENQKEEIGRLLNISATKMENWEYEENADYAVLPDPGQFFYAVQV